MTRAYASTNNKPIPFSNGAGYRNPKIDCLFSRAAGTIDPAWHQRLDADIQASLTDEVPYWWLVETER